MEIDEQNRATFTAQVGRISTSVDGGWRITLECGRDATGEIVKASGWVKENVQVAIIPVLPDND